MGLDIYVHESTHPQGWQKAIEDTNKMDELREATLKQFNKTGSAHDLTAEERFEVKNRLDAWALETNCVHGTEDWHQRGMYYFSKYISDLRDVKCPLFPEHLWSMGYYRSSYNSGGINRVLSDLGVGDLHYIFQPPGDEYEFLPAWGDVFGRTKEVLSAVERIDKEGKNVAFEFVAWPGHAKDKAPKDANSARELFLAELQKGSIGDSCYSNGFGDFFLSHSAKVRAWMPGTDNWLGVQRPGVWIVLEQDLTWYIQALKILAEAAAHYALETVEGKKEFYVTWSC